MSAGQCRCINAGLLQGLPKLAVIEGGLMRSQAQRGHKQDALLEESACSHLLFAQPEEKHFAWQAQME